MIKPVRRIRGVDQTGLTEVWVFSRDQVANAVAFGTGGIKSDNLFVAGLVEMTLYYVLSGAGTTTIRIIPMDEDDNLELPIVLTLGSGIATGAGFLPIAVTLVATSIKMQAVSTSTNTITAILMGRTA